MPSPTAHTRQNEQALRDEIARLNKIVKELTTKSERDARSLQEQLQELAIHDPLTGLYNRDHFNETFNRELIRAERHNHPISVIMADIDNLKVINDTYGNLAGDEVLKAFGVLLKRNARASDIISRYGGEEFLLILSNMKMEDACKRAELLRSLFVSTPISCGTSIIHAMASFGVAAFPEHGKTSDELITTADTAMSSAKTDGRNQVKLFNKKMNPDYLA